MRKVQKLLIIGLLASVFTYIICQNVSRPLWVPDETRTAQVTQEMIFSKDPIFLTLNGNRYYEKPPLYFWIVYLFSKVTGGVNEISVRMPSFLSIVGLVVLSLYFGKNLHSISAGFYSSFVYATLIVSILLSQYTSFDTLFAFLMSTGLFFFIRKKSNLQRKDFVFGFLFFGLAVLVKGAYGVFIPLVLLTIFFALEKRLKEFFNWNLLPGFLVAILVVSVWFIPSLLKEGNLFLNKMFREQTLERIISPKRHEQPLFYYFYMFPLHTFPWCIFFIFVVVSTFVRRISFSCIEKALLLWVAVILIIFTIPEGKGGFYIFPLMLPFSVFCGISISKILEEKEKKTIRIYGIIMGIFFVLMVISIFVFQQRYHGAYEGSIRFISGVFLFFFVLFAIFHILSLIEKRGFLVFYMTGFCSALMIISIQNIASQHFIYKSKSTKNFITQVKEIVKDGELIMYDIPEHFVFYSGRSKIEKFNRKDLEALKNKFGGTKKVYCIIKREQMNIIDNIRTKTLLAERIDNDDYVLISNEETDRK